MTKNFNIGITCIGTGVGQSIINSCKISNLPIKTFGFGSNTLAYGLFDCDFYIKTKAVNHDSYIDELIVLCKNYQIDLLIPGADDEILIFSKNISKFNNANIKVIVAEHNLIAFCQNKAKMTEELNKISPIFVKSFSKENFIKTYYENKIQFPVIAKPIYGSGSKGIQIINCLNKIAELDSTFIIQEIAIPNQEDPERLNYEQKLKQNYNEQVSEISIQVVTDLEGEVIGRMISQNKLKNGIPIEILPLENESIDREINKVLPFLKSMGLKGPINFQGRLTDNGLKLFEINTRFTGITGVRAAMGFNEVEICIKDWLKIDYCPNSLFVNLNKIGLRQVADKVISLDKTAAKDVYNDAPKRNKIILFTGATGYLGRNLIEKLIENKETYEIWALVREKEKAQKILPASVICFDNFDLTNGHFSLGNVDTLIHAGFARPHLSHAEISESIAFTSDLFKKAVENQIPNIINISSQSVYGQNEVTPWSETSKTEPNTTYGMAKYASELLLSEMANQYKHINYTSLRLGTITGGAKGLLDIGVTIKLVLKAIKSEKIVLNAGGKQIVETLDVRDAVDALIALLNSSNTNWKPIYNLGSSAPIELIDLTNLIVDIVSKETNLTKSEIEIKVEGSVLRFGMNCQNFYQDFDWSPTYSIKDSIKSLIEYYQ
jgi:nucleoside-diphosphate-sugar epimerase/carbamoylphosphate synthase large subunit